MEESVMSEEIGLRALEKEDLPFIHKLNNNVEIMSYWFEEAYKTMTELETSFEKDISNPHQRQFILNKGSERLGLVELVSIDYMNRKAEFTIMMDPAHQGNGYAGIATRLAVDYAFNIFNLHKLYLIVDEVNEKAIHIYKKIGFHEEATLKEEYFVNGSYHNIVIMSMFEDDYKALDK